MYETKTEDVYEDLSSDKERLHVINFPTKPKSYDNSNKLVFSKMKDETGGIAIEEFLELNPKKY